MATKQTEQIEIVRGVVWTVADEQVIEVRSEPEPGGSTHHRHDWPKTIEQVENPWRTVRPENEYRPTLGSIQKTPSGLLTEEERKQTARPEIVEWEPIDDSDDPVVHLLGGGQMKLSDLVAMEGAYRTSPAAATCTPWRQAMTGGGSSQPRNVVPREWQDTEGEWHLDYNV